jgi:hypothetical protein
MVCEDTGVAYHGAEKVCEDTRWHNMMQVMCVKTPMEDGMTCCKEGL